MFESLVNLARLHIDDNDNEMAFVGKYCLFCAPCSVFCIPHCAQAANGTKYALQK